MRGCDNPTSIATLLALSEVEGSESAAADESRDLLHPADLLLEKNLFNAAQNPLFVLCSAPAEPLAVCVPAAPRSPSACCNARANSGTATRPENSHSGMTRASRISSSISGVGYSGGTGARAENVSGATTV